MPIRTKCLGKAAIAEKLQKSERMDVRGSGRELPWIGEKYDAKSSSGEDSKVVRERGKG